MVFVRQSELLEPDKKEWVCLPLQESEHQSLSQLNGDVI